MCFSNEVKWLVQFNLEALKKNDFKVNKLCEQNQSLTNEVHTLQCKLEEEVSKTNKLKEQLRAPVKQNCDLQVKDQVPIHQDVVVQCEEESPQQSYDDLEGNIRDLNKFLINKDERNLCKPKGNWSAKI
jgi:hypothetical protein